MLETGVVQNNNTGALTTYLPNSFVESRIVTDVVKSDVSVVQFRPRWLIRIEGSDSGGLSQPRIPFPLVGPHSQLRPPAKGGNEHFRVIRDPGFCRRYR